MTEAEWLASDDPAAMLRLCDPSERKLRLFAAACCRAVWPSLDDPSRLAVAAVEAYIEEDGGQPHVPLQAVRHSYRTVSGLAAIAMMDFDLLRAAFLDTRAYEPEPPASARAALLRDIVGNPSRPVTRHRVYRTGDPDAPSVVKDWNGHVALDMCRDCGKGESELSGPCVWLTPLVVAIAREAYDERPGRKCEACGGRGFPKRDPRLDCDACHGTGRIEDRTLDPDRLAVLRDALEDAGCPTTEECPSCDGVGAFRSSLGRCDKCGYTGRVPHPLLAHLREPGPHVRGCWAVDLLLGY